MTAVQRGDNIKSIIAAAKLTHIDFSQNSVSQNGKSLETTVSVDWSCTAVCRGKCTAVLLYYCIIIFLIFNHLCLATAIHNFNQVGGNY